MTTTDETELLEPVAEFRGLPSSELLEAQAWAEVELTPYWAKLLERFAKAGAERILVQAAAHYLATTRAPLAQPDTPHSPRRGYQVGRPSPFGDWAGSPYGDAVARALAGSGAIPHRRCSPPIVPPI